MAHVNTAGVHVPLWMDSTMSSIGWGVDRTNYPMQEGTFFGDIIDTGALTATSKPGVTAPVGYYCDGAGYPAGANGVVAGRIGGTSRARHISTRTATARSARPRRRGRSLLVRRVRQLSGRLELQPAGGMPGRL